MTTWYDATADATTIYSYYKGGNLAKIFSNGDFISFTYGGGDGIADRIVVYDGQLLSYDMIGNPLTYRDGMSFTWKNGRQLATFTQGQTSASYNYNESGIRTDKTVNGITTTYQLDGSKIVSENRNGTVQSYFYDESGSVLGIVYNGSNYYFRKNFRNDVLAILNASGEVVVGYSYDPWGNILSVTGSMASTLGVANPFRYRSYYYDTESGLYYLNSRYYDAKVCRFINTDNILSNNIYSYCYNNPVNYYDITGLTPESLFSFAETLDTSPLVIAGQAIYTGIEPFITKHGTPKAQRVYALVGATADIVLGCLSIISNDFLGVWDLARGLGNAANLALEVLRSDEMSPVSGSYYYCNSIYDPASQKNWVEVYIDTSYTFQPTCFFYDSQTVFYTPLEEDAIKILKYPRCELRKATYGSFYYLCDPKDNSIKYAICYFGNYNTKFMYYADRFIKKD